MAYGLQYRHYGSNELNQDVELLIYRKDVPDNVVNFDLQDDIVLDDDAEGGIISRSMAFSIFADDAFPGDWDTFLSDNVDEWLCILYVDSRLNFHGFIAPDEGNRPLIDKPYPISITATGALKLIKDVPLTDQSGNRMKGNYSLMAYIAACLSKTLLNLPIRVYSSLYESTMVNRGADINKDMFQQTYLNARSFMESATTATNCFQTLNYILGNTHRLFYWNGMWVIEYIPDHQFSPVGRYYTDYNPDGSVIGGMLDTENYAQVGKAQLIYPMNESPLQSSSFAIKSTRTSFEYNVWPELPLNNKFERGTLVDQGNQADIYDQDNDGNTTEQVGIYKRFTIEDWFYGLNTGPTSNTNLPILQPTAAKAYRRSIYNRYGIELIRELQLNTTGDPFNSEKWLQSEGIPVRYGDKISLDFNFRTENNIAGSGAAINTVRIYIVTGGGRKVSLRWDESMLFGQWIQTDGGLAQRAVVVNYVNGDDTSKYRTISLESNPIPADGIMYVVLGATTQNGTYYYSGFNLEYIPYVAGGYIPVKGDYWEHGQNKTILDKEEETSFLSDSQIQVVRGALRTATNATTPTWYRYGVAESRHYKELTNIGRFNLRYRRYWNVEGEFNSTDYEPENNQLNKQPIGYHKNYYFPDFTSPRLFVLTPPLTLNITQGTMRGSFDEIVDPAKFVTRIDNAAEKIIGAINSTSLATWQSTGQAPAVGTPGFPPQASKAFISGSNDIYLFVPLTATPTYSASANGAGNAPTLTQISQTSGTFKWIVLRVGPSVAVGNRYTITIFGVPVTVEIEENPVYNDGNNLGDYNDFNFIFDK